MKKRLPKTLAALLGFCLMTGPVAFAQTSVDPFGDDNPVAKESPTTQQLGRLPADNVAFFGASQVVRVKLDLMSVMPDAAAELNRAKVTVIRPNGEVSLFRPDFDGTVLINDATPGLHAIIASGGSVHGAMMYYFEEKTVDLAGKTPAKTVADALDQGSDARPVQMTMLQISEQELRSAIDRCRGVNARMSPVIGAGVMAERFSYQVKLGPEGTLTGQLVPFANRNGVLAGTDVTIYFNGDAVGTTKADANGRFQIAGLRSGVHGLVASGGAGYTAFAFDASDPGDVVMTNTDGESFVTAMAQATGVLPVVLIAPPMVPGVVSAVENDYPSMQQPGDGMIVDAPLGEPIGPVAGAFTPGPMAGSPIGGGAGGGFGGGGGGFGGGGLGGLAGLAGIGAIIAATSDDDDNNAIAAPEPISPSRPAN